MIYNGNLTAPGLVTVTGGVDVDERATLTAPLLRADTAARS